MGAARELSGKNPTVYRAKPIKQRLTPSRAGHSAELSGKNPTVYRAKPIKQR